MALRRSLFCYSLSMFPGSYFCKTATRLITGLKWTKGIHECDRKGAYQDWWTSACIQALPSLLVLCETTWMFSPIYTRQSYFEENHGREITARLAKTVQSHRIYQLYLPTASSNIILKICSRGNNAKIVVKGAQKAERFWSRTSQQSQITLLIYLSKRS